MNFYSFLHPSAFYATRWRHFHPFGNPVADQGGFSVTGGGTDEDEARLRQEGPVEERKEVRAGDAARPGRWDKELGG